MQKIIITKIFFSKAKTGVKQDEEAPQFSSIYNPRLDFNALPEKINGLLSKPHILLKSFLFAPKPDEFLMKDDRRSKTYNWITGLKNQKYFTLVEGTHSARPVSGFTYKTMDITNSQSYYVVEKGTDINLAIHLITKGFMNAYDTAIIVSGDTDYIPVLDILNTLGKNTVIVGVKGQNLNKFIQHSDEQIILDNTLFQSCVRPTPIYHETQDCGNSSQEAQIVAKL